MHTEYLDTVFDKSRRSKVVRKVRESLRAVPFDAFVCRGVSGLTMGSILAHSMRKDLVVIRKSEDDSHSDYEIEYGGDGRRLVILDDLISSGDTLEAVVGRLRNFSRKHEIELDLQAIVFYNYFKYWDEGDYSCNPIIHRNDERKITRAHDLSYAFDLS